MYHWQFFSYLFNIRGAVQFIENLPFILDFMLSWIISFFTKFFTYLIAPILFHFPCDGYVIMFMCVIMELCDTFASYKLYFLFLLFSVLARNYLFSVFKSSLTLCGRFFSSKDLGTTPKNKLKTLGASSFTNLKSSLSSAYKYLKNKFFN